MKSKRIGLLVTLAALLGAAASAASAAPPAVQLTARLLYNWVEGPTRVAGSAGINLSEGELGAVTLAAGEVSRAAPRCAAIARTRGAGAAFVGQGYRWRIEAKLERAVGDAFDLRVKWSRDGRRADGAEAKSQDELRVSLHSGERRQIDFVDFQPVAGDGSCHFEKLIVEIEPRLLGDPAYARKDLRYDVWFAQTHGDERRESAFLTMTGAQGEPMAFPVEPLETELALASGTRGTLQSSGRGTVTAWMTGRDTVSIRLDAVLRHRLRPGDAAISSGEGSKLYEAKLGETVEIELPPLYATLVVATDSLGLSGAPADGVEIEGETTRLKLWKLTGGASWSLLLRVREAG